jgi:hypothetical protein
LPLKLCKHLLHRKDFEYVLGGCREDSKDGEGAVLLVLLEAAPQTLMQRLT